MTRRDICVICGELVMDADVCCVECGESTCSSHHDIQLNSVSSRLAYWTSIVLNDSKMFDKFVPKIMELLKSSKVFKEEEEIQAMLLETNTDDILCYLDNVYELFDYRCPSCDLPNNCKSVSD